MADKYFVASSIHGHQVLSEAWDDKAGNHYEVHADCSTLAAAEDKAIELNAIHRISFPGRAYFDSLGADSPLRKGTIDYDQQYIWEVYGKETGDIPWDTKDCFVAPIDVDPLKLYELTREKHNYKVDSFSLRVTGPATIVEED